MSPIRVQRKRTKGWKAPLCSCGCGKPARYVGRPTRWGNPFEVYKCPCCGFWDVRDDNGVTYHIDHGYARSHPHDSSSRIEAVRHSIDLYCQDFVWCSQVTGREIREELGGHDLMCWCSLGQPCHADVMLELANRVAS